MSTRTCYRDEDIKLNNDKGTGWTVRISTGRERSEVSGSVSTWI